jgi:hypothetical protein
MGGLSVLMMYAVAPFGIWLVGVRIMSLGVFLEELIKWLLARWGESNDEFETFWLGGVLFGISELVLRLPSLMAGGLESSVIWRLLLTVPMHAVTAMISGKWKLGLFLSLGIHLGFNYLVGNSSW